ncbi:serine O-acetyltransferase EpsC [Cytophagaceae bacterium ABcell3]|nr:serine O-acetyltransferase EpsC [Cytophagaceae bacterium ABcell3]
MKNTFVEKLYLKHQEIPRLPATSAISRLITKILLVMFPEQSRVQYKDPKDIENFFERREQELIDILSSMEHLLPCPAPLLSAAYMKKIPEIYDYLIQDIHSILNGDPAAKTEYEVIRTYPGFYAIAFYRLAHGLYQLNIPLLPRILTEYAHSRTGIDIHPAAQIQPNFFIDHGTGIVIGETAVIGKNVKLYQGVTLGAMSVSKDMAETKRHPTIEDNVVIYSGATILGGETVIGHDSIIGGNVWLTTSVPPFSRVYHQAQVKMTRKTKI